MIRKKIAAIDIGGSVVGGGVSSMRSKYSVSPLSFNVVRVIRDDSTPVVEYHIVYDGDYIAARCWNKKHAAVIARALNDLETPKPPIPETERKMDCVRQAFNASGKQVPYAIEDGDFTWVVPVGYTLRRVSEPEVVRFKFRSKKLTPRKE